MKTATQLGFTALLMTSVMLTGCLQTTNVNTAPTPNADGNTPVISSEPRSAQQVTFKAIPLDYQLPKELSERCVDEPSEGQIACPEFQIQLAQIQPKWIEDVINLEITDDNNPKNIKFKRYLDSYAMMQYKDASPFGYQLDITPKQINAHNNVAQFSILQYTYLGGAHGLPALTYHLFDMTLQSEIELWDVFIDDDEDFYHFAQDAYYEYLASQDITSAEDIEAYTQTWPFTLTDNFYFEGSNIILVYQPYELGSYAQGFIELKVPLSSVEDNVRPEYLPQQ